LPPTSTTTPKRFADLEESYWKQIGDQMDFPSLLIFRDVGLNMFKKTSRDRTKRSDTVEQEDAHAVDHDQQLHPYSTLFTGQEIVRIFKQQEDFYRWCFAAHRDSFWVEDPYLTLIPIFDNHELFRAQVAPWKRPKPIGSMSRLEIAGYEFEPDYFYKESDEMFAYANGWQSPTAYAVCGDFDEFREAFRVFSQGVCVSNANANANAMMLVIPKRQNLSFFSSWISQDNSST
jgi:hypothetical protein